VDALSITQHRLREKRFLARHGFPTVPFAPATTLNELRTAVAQVGTPAVVKTAAFGYDGKGQHGVGAATNLPQLWDAVQGQEVVVERFVDLQTEISVIAARGLDGKTVEYVPCENRHTDHILDVTTAPAVVPASVAARAGEITRGILEQLHYVGVLCVEFFVTADGALLVNEVAPRPHNSGHLTFDAAVTSQFEQQVRAVCGLPLGSPALIRPAAMANLLGDLWAERDPDWAAALRFPDVKLHLYGKATARPGRKMGHLIALAGSAREAQTLAEAARDALTGPRDRS
jgi:5-(carboxyamino)imidazole ribonucleotide synthase